MHQQTAVWYIIPCKVKHFFVCRIERWPGNHREIFKSVPEPCHIKAEQWAYLGDFFAIPHSHIKRYPWFQAAARLLLLPCCGDPPGAPHWMRFLLRGKKPWGDGQRCKPTAALGVLSFRPPTRIIWDLRELMPFWTPRDLHHTWRKSPWEAAMANIFQSPLCPGWLRTGHTHTPVPGLQQPGEKPEFLCRDKSKYQF